MSLPEQPAEFVTVTDTMPARDVVMFCVVSPDDHSKESKVPASRVVLSPGQRLVSPVITGCGTGLSTIVTASVPVQPLPSVTVIVIVPGVEIFTDCVDSLVDHSYTSKLPVVNVVFIPAQNVVSPVMTGCGLRCSVTVTVSAPVQAFASVTVTVYTPEDIAIID
jgi:hypothetical protein